MNLEKIKNYLDRPFTFRRKHFVLAGLCALTLTLSAFAGFVYNARNELRNYNDKLKAFNERIEKSNKSLEQSAEGLEINLKYLEQSRRYLQQTISQYGY